MFSRYLKMAALCVGVTIIAAGGTASLMAQTYPVQPIKVIVGFGPGSAADILARLVGKQMEVRLGQPMALPRISLPGLLASRWKSVSVNRSWSKIGRVTAA